MVGVNDDMRLSIGELAQRTGLTVKTIRFYSECGVVSPVGRTSAGHREYAPDAVARLDLVRTLRELGLDLATVRRVVDREASLSEIAARHAEALGAQVRDLRLRQAVFAVVARLGTTLEETDLLHGAARLCAAERTQVVERFLDTVFAGRHTSPELAGIAGSLTPYLPEDPESAQVEAWIELAALIRQPEFCRMMADLVAQFQADREAVGSPLVRRDAVGLACEPARSALAAGVDPRSAEAEPYVVTGTSGYAALVGGPDDTVLRQRMAGRLRRANDPRRERYEELVSIINGWSPPEPVAPALDWFLAALDAQSSTRLT